MPQINQIVPRFSFSYVETVINDYTLVDDSLNNDMATPHVTYIFPFISGQGIDNKFIRKRTARSFVNTYGDSNYRKYGQPLMMPLKVLENSSAEVWAMRVMPDNAAYANALISIGYKADAVDEYQDAPSKRKFRIKFVQESGEDLHTTADFKSAFNGMNTSDPEGFTVAPFMSLRSSGRGKYGNDYTVKISQNLNYEKETGLKMYNFDILSVTAGLEKIATYVGAAVSTDKYTIATHIDDVLADAETGVAPVDISIDENVTLDVYDAYIKFCKEQHILLQEEYDTKLASYGVPSGMIDGSEAVTEEYADQVAELREIQSLIDATATDELPDVDEFDPFYGIEVADVGSQPFISFVESADNADESAEDYDPNDYTSTSADAMPDFDSVKGIEFANGSDGDFDSDDKEAVEAAIESAYNKAFDGTYDRRILSAKRIPADALFDANYPFSVKCTMAELAAVRNDAPVYLDTGLDIDEFTLTNIRTLVNKYSIFDTKLVSVNAQKYTVREQSTGRRVPVTITYDLISHFTDHVLVVGSHVPMVKASCQLSDHIKDSLVPAIEDFETDLKETFYNNRINFYETLDENIFQRACQNTTQKANTDLLEESNVHTLYLIKRICERDIQERLYNFADTASRQAFTAYEQAKFASWIGNKVLSIDIYFRANAWEQEHSIVHCYVAVVFRGLQKRAILEIDINKRAYEADVTADDETTTYDVR